jgi:hypothetical protein
MGIHGNQQEVPLATNTAENDISGQEALINVYPRKSIGGKYPFNLINSPGLAFFTELPTFPIKALHEINGRGFAVTPSKLYEFFSDGSFNELGDVDFTGTVVTEDNGDQIVMVDGSKGYYYDDTTKEVEQLSGDGWYPARTVTYQDGYFIFDRKGTGQFFISDLLNVTFDPLDFASAEGQPDPLLAVLSDHREVFMFGTQTIEVWYNSGASDFPFERNQGAFIEKGLAAAYTVTKQNNTVYFVGSDLMVYQLSGYIPQRISTHAVEETLSGVDLSDAFAYSMQDDGHLFYILTIPSAGVTWRYDISTSGWHKLADYNFSRHRSIKSIFLNGKTLTGDFQGPRIYQMAKNYYTDDGEPIVREFILPTINMGREFISIDSFELDMSSGVGLTTGQGSDPLAWMRFSKDNGKTWSNWKESKIGKKGKYLTRVKWNRLGAARQFTIHIRISDPAPIDIGGAYIETR